MSITIININIITSLNQTLPGWWGRLAT